MLPEYVAYIEEREEELLPGLLKILQAANHFHFNVDDILQHFKQVIVNYRDHQGYVSGYNQQAVEERYITFTAEIAQYYVKWEQCETSIIYILESLECSIRTNRQASIIKCVGMFEQLRHIASIESIRKYQYLIGEMHRNNKKKNSFIVGA